MSVNMKELKAFTKKTNTRYVILTILFITTAINYIDRSALSVAAPVMSKELQLDAVSLGIAFSAFNCGMPFCKSRAAGCSIDLEHVLFMGLGCSYGHCLPFFKDGLVVF